jgi:hypothetical protein
MVGYILKGREVVRCDDFLVAARWYETHREERRVAESWPEYGGQRFHVSTVFLGTDHRYFGAGTPLVFETMTFADATGWSDLACERTSTWEEAEAAHARAVADVLAGKVVIGGEP